MPQQFLCFLSGYLPLPFPTDSILTLLSSLGYSSITAVTKGTVRSSDRARDRDSACSSGIGLNAISSGVRCRRMPGLVCVGFMQSRLPHGLHSSYGSPPDIPRSVIRSIRPESGEGTKRRHGGHTYVPRPFGSLIKEEPRFEMRDGVLMHGNPDSSLRISSARLPPGRSHGFRLRRDGDESYVSEIMAAALDGGLSSWRSEKAAAYLEILAGNCKRSRQRGYILCGSRALQRPGVVCVYCVWQNGEQKGAVPWVWRALATR
jgi:hypothetical protein